MPITDREPDLPVVPPKALQSERGARKVLVHDPIGAPSVGSHDEWHAKFVAESCSLLTGWAGEPALKEAPEPGPDATEALLLVARSDGKAWPAGTAKRQDFAEKLRRYAAWAQQGRLWLYGAVPSPSRVLRSPAVDWPVADKEQWASWWDQVWPQLPCYGSVLERPSLYVGDEACWAFAMPGDLVVAARGVSPMGLSERLRSVLASRSGGFANVNVCCGLSWAESQKEESAEYWQARWEELCRAFWSIGETLKSEGYGEESPDMADVYEGTSPPWRACFVEPPHCAPDDLKLAPFVHRDYARSLVCSAAKAYLPFRALEEGSWQEPELPNVVSPRHAAKTGCGVLPKSRSWTPARAKAGKK